MFIPDDPVLAEKELGKGFVPDVPTVAPSEESSFVPDDTSEKPSILKTIGSIAKGTRDVALEVSKGVAQAELKTIKGIGTLGQTILDQTAGRVVNATRGKGFTPLGPDLSLSDIYRNKSVLSDKADNFLRAQNGWQMLGQTGERIAEFLIPASKIGKGAEIVGGALGSLAAKTGVKGLETVANLAGQGLVQGAFAGGQTALQTGKIGTEAKVNALISALFPAVALTAKSFGSKIMDVVIKPSNADVKNGFSPKTIAEYNLGGNLKTSLTKTTSKLNGLSKELDAKLANADDVVDVDAVVTRTIDKLQNKKTILLGQVADTHGAIAELKNDLTDFMKLFADNEVSFNLKNVPIQIANNQMKRGAGTKGSWIYGRIDKNAAAIDHVYSVFYNELKTEIEKVGPAGIKSLNDAMHKLIPVQSAIIRQIPISARAQVMGLADTIFTAGSIMDPRTLALYAPYLAFKSGPFANFLLTAANSAIPGAVTKTAVSQSGQ